MQISVLRLSASTLTYTSIKTACCVSPNQQLGKNPFEMYEQLCTITGQRHDPCVIDVFISVMRFADEEEPRPWWKYTVHRKLYLERLELKK